MNPDDATVLDILTDTWTKCGTPFTGTCRE